MDPAIITIISKSILAALLIGGGIAALFIGKNLYLKGIGLQPDKTTVVAHKIKASLKTVGSVVMTTSVAWGGLGYLTSPTFSYGPEGTKVASLKLPEFNIEAKQLAYPVSGENAKRTLSDPAALREVFALAYKQAQDQTLAITVNDQPATLKLNRVATLKNAKNQVFVVGIVESGGRDVALTYRPKIKDESLLFVPQYIELLESSPVAPRNNTKTPDKPIQPTR